MAHIPDGLLSVPVLVAGAALCLGGTAWGLSRLPPQRVAPVAMVSALMFVAALVHFPVGPSSAHLMLNGLAGMILGPAVFPALLVAAFLQAVMFGFGGLVVLGVNVTNMGVPALLAWWGLRRLARPGNPRRTALVAAALAALAVCLTGAMVSAGLALSGRQFLPAVVMVMASCVPIMVIESVFTLAAIGLVLKVSPEILDMPPCD